MPTQGEIFGSGSQLGVLYAVSRDQGGHGSVLPPVVFAVMLCSSELGAWKLVESIPQSHQILQSGLRSGIRYKDGKRLAECMVGQHRLLCHPVGR